MRARKIHVLGIEANPLDVRELNESVRDTIESARRDIYGYQNLHGVYLFHKDERMRSFFDMCHRVPTDGMSLIFWAKLLGYPVRRQHRVTYVDWVDPLLNAANRHGWRVFYLGGQPHSVQRGTEILMRRYPGLQIEAEPGHFDSTAGHEDSERVLGKINSHRPHLLMVGMGMPLQEHWILENHEKLNANAILTCGACIDYISGTVPTAPRWLGRIGLEWAFRLSCEPRRLWKRCFVEPWSLLGQGARDLKAKYRKLSH